MLTTDLHEIVYFERSVKSDLFAHIPTRFLVGQKNAETMPTEFTSIAVPQYLLNDMFPGNNEWMRTDRVNAEKTASTTKL
jgi:hypothetical protein